MTTITAYRYTADPTGDPALRWTDYTMTLPAPHYGFDAQKIQLELMTSAARILDDGTLEVTCEHVDRRGGGLHFQELWSGAPICSPRWNGRYVETLTLQAAIDYGIVRIVA